MKAVLRSPTLYGIDCGHRYAICRLTNRLIVEGVVSGNYWQNLQVRTEGSGSKRGRCLRGRKEINCHISFAISHLLFKNTSRRFSQINADQNDGLKELFLFAFSVWPVYRRKICDWCS